MTRHILALAGYAILATLFTISCESKKKTATDTDTERITTTVAVTSTDNESDEKEVTTTERESGQMSTKLINGQLNKGYVGDGKFKHFTSTKINADMDDELEELILTADLEIDKKGRVVWDDAQEWNLYVQDGDERRYIYIDDIQNGKLIVHYNSRLKEVYLEEDAPYKKGKYMVDLSDGVAIEAIDKIPLTKTKLDLTVNG